MDMIPICVLCLWSFIIVKGESEWHGESLGCYYDRGDASRTFPQQGFTAKKVDGLTIGKCINACRKKGYRFAGVEYFKQCYCDNGFPSKGTAKSKERYCDTPCDGNADEICGGGDALSVYTVCRNGTFGKVDSDRYEDYGCPNTCDHCTSGYPPCHPATGKCNDGTCSPNTYGDDCTPCGNCMNPACGSTGDCDDKGCKAGYKGQECLEVCDSYNYGPNCATQCGQCTGACNTVDGACSGGCNPGYQGITCKDECAQGKYGRNCASSCGHCVGTCDKKTGYCTKCEPGWKGTWCKDDCDDGTYDNGCNKQCGNCRQRPCNKVNGHCDKKECLAGWKGDLCKQGCDSTTYGENCLQQCGQCSEYCSRFDGRCDGGCKEGYEGTTCHTECAAGKYGRDCAMSCGQCIGTCDSKYGNCPKCKPGWTGTKCTECDYGKYGSECNETCGQCKETPCNKMNGYCPNQECDTGWKGPLCKQECENGSFGFKCEEVCGNCLSLPCDKVTGDCNDENCTRGWKGAKCTEECKNGTFGFSCQDECRNCAGLCNRFNGSCDGKGCRAGWKGPTCEDECQDGTYGSNCSKTCGDCSGEPCDKKTGFCTKCDPGWQGPQCNTACSNGTFGANCKGKCGQCDGSCSNVNGSCISGKCMQGWTGSLCAQELVSTTTKPPSVGMIAGGAAAAVLLIVLIPVIILIIVKRRRNANKSDEMLAEDNVKGERSLYANVNHAGPNIEIEDKSEKNSPTDSTLPLSNLKAPQKKAKVPPPVSVVKPMVKPGILPKPKKTTSDANSKSSTEPAPSNSGAGEGTEESTSPIYGNQATIPIKLKDLDKYIQKKHAENDGFFQEFQSIPSGKLRDWKVATEPANSKLKNRFKNVYAYDHSRVHLNTLPNDPHSDYINASYINGYRGKKFIATQGPKKTGGDLWRMVWEQKVTRIVMVTNLNEGGADKCDKYWPNENEAMTLGHFTVTNQKEENFPGYVLRTIKLSEVKDESSLYGNVEGGDRTVLQFHYTDWPDKDVPLNGSVMINFMRKVRAFSVNVSSPIVVHCSAGVGRTGTFLALDYLTDQAAAEGIVDIYKCVTLMREDRTNMVQTPSQYVFIYEAISEALAVGETMIPGHAFANTLIELQKTEKGKGCPRMETQFKMLMKFSQKVLKEEEFTKANLPENQPKNRSKMNLPSDNVCPLLMTAVNDRNNYINAAFVDGYGKKASNLLTQLPLKDTVVDFWRLVYDYNINTIIMLTSYQSKEFKSVPYCPMEDIDNLDVEPFVIEKKKVTMSGDILSASIHLTLRTDTKKILVVCPTNWSKDAWKPDNISTFGEIYNKVQEWKSAKDPMAKTIVQCFDGGMKSGMYATVSCMFDMIQAEQGVDIYQISKQILQTRPECLTNMDQYRDLHYIANDHFQKVSTYANM